MEIMRLFGRVFAAPEKEKAPVDDDAGAAVVPIDRSILSSNGNVNDNSRDAEVVTRRNKPLSSLQHSASFRYVEFMLK